MRQRTPITLFPFLSVLLSTMGILAFLAVTFLLLSRAEVDVPVQEPIEVRWVGAPEHVRPLLVECRADEVRVHDPDRPGVRIYSQEDIREEARTVRDLEFEGLAELGPVVDRAQLLRLLKSRIRRRPSLQTSLTLSLDRLEAKNLRSREMARDVRYYPVLLVYRDGVETYDLVSYLIETTTRLTVGLEPMLESWGIPYRNGST